MRATVKHTLSSKEIDSRTAAPFEWKEMEEAGGIEGHGIRLERLKSLQIANEKFHRNEYYTKFILRSTEVQN
jgi:hypothetical protein